VSIVVMINYLMFDVEKIMHVLLNCTA